MSRYAQLDGFGFLMQSSYLERAQSIVTQLERRAGRVDDNVSRAHVEMHRSLRMQILQSLSNVLADESSQLVVGTLTMILHHRAQILALDPFLHESPVSLNRRRN